MTLVNTGVVSGDFQQILNDMGVTLSYSVVTRTNNPITGEETTTFAAATDVTAVFFLNENKYIWDKEGLLEVGDAYIIAATSVGIKRYDQFSYGGQTYYVENTIRRLVAGVTMCDYAVCFRVT